MKLTPLLFGVVGSFLLGCTKSGVVGSWRAPSVTKGRIVHPVLVLNLKGDGRFEFGPEGSHKSLEGTYQVKDGTVRLSPDTLLGKPLHESVLKQVEANAREFHEPIDKAKEAAQGVESTFRDLGEFRLDKDGKTITWKEFNFLRVFRRS